MRKYLAFLPLFLGIAWANIASAAGTARVDLTATPTISVTGVTRVCQGEVPYARLNLLVNVPDKGRPGLVYVGSHDPAQTVAEFFYSGQWTTWDGGLYPPHLIVRGGLNDVTLYVPYDRLVEKLGWRLYVGYGVLTAEDEQKVQRMIQSYQIAKTKLPDRQIPTVDPDHFRRVLIQMNMTDNIKYRYVTEWTSDLSGLCVTSSGS